MTVTTFLEQANSRLTPRAVNVGVYRLNDDGSYELLDNINVLSVQVREGAQPSLARFRYNPNTKTNFLSISSYEQSFGVNGSLSGFVQTDDRLVVICFPSPTTQVLLFDGFAQVPSLSLFESGEVFSFSAYGVEIRAWDSHITGSAMLNVSGDTMHHFVETPNAVHFNPRGEPNASGVTNQASDSNGNEYPVFVDELLVRNPDVRNTWTLSNAIRYLCFHENASQPFVTNPNAGLIDRLFVSRSPTNGLAFDPSDPTSFTTNPIEVPDFPVTGKTWPNVIEELLRPNGFGITFRVESVIGGSPQTRLDIFRLRDNSPAIVKDLYLQARGTSLDPNLSNVCYLDLVRDTSHIANSYKVDSHPISYEASFILAPGFEIDPKDALTASSLAAFNLSTNNGRSDDAYRLYVFDETGEGHWDWKASTLSSSPTSLDALFRPDSKRKVDQPSKRRIPHGGLFTRDSNEKPLKARLSISTDYTGAQPGLWDGSGTWQLVNGGYSLLEDRLGIWINAANPNGWVIGPSNTTSAPFPAGVVRAVEDQASPSRARFILRLTCVIDGDEVTSGSAPLRPTSPTKYEIMRRIDARDRYFKQIIAPQSEFNQSNKSLTARDDSSEAQAEAEARRMATETGTIRGSVTIPRFTTAYQIGDRIRSIKGREVFLQTNAGSTCEESPVYPAIVGVIWEFDGEQKTSLFLSDERGS